MTPLREEDIINPYKPAGGSVQHRQNEAQPVIKVPGPLAVAIATGRPELARIGIQNMHTTLTLDDVKAVSDYAEALVKEIQMERERIAIMYNAVRDAAQNISGALGAMERVEDALRLVRDGAAAEVVAQALINPRSKRTPMEVAGS